MLFFIIVFFNFDYLLIDYFLWYSFDFFCTYKNVANGRKTTVEFDFF